jgi:hypothetical protein
MGLFKSVKPEIDLSKVDKVMKGDFFGGEETIKLLEEQKRILPCKSREEHEGKDAMRILRRGGEPMNSKPKVLEIAELSAIFLLCRLQEQP